MCTIRQLASPGLMQNANRAPLGIVSNNVTLKEFSSGKPDL